MIESYTENKWNKFELSGRVTDYLEYKGIPTKNFSNIKGEHTNADNGDRTCNSGTQLR
ncbi:MAG: hypothetical protein NC253_02710 [Ruminococcus sp.]|nr:hypothetical protein [Ruminococcus sp.]MCM1381702.1 hypothetical protein [Muribaculaceae bacterium]MCM1479587.1 hypothetical protein [Muribaculaceae bacterium]